MSFAFDPLKYTQGAVSIGMPREQAEYHAEQLYSLVKTDLATKKDIEDLEGVLKQDIDDLEVAVRKDFVLLEQQLSSEIKNIDLKLSSEIKNLELRMTIRLGSIVIATGAILGIVQHFIK